MLFPAQPARSSISFVVLATLAVILAASVWMFRALVRRATHGRRQVILSDWARANGAAVIREAWTELPQRYAMFAPYHAQASLVIRGKEWSLLEMTTDAPAEAKGRAPRWHVLARQIETDWSPTGLRPVAHTVSLLDLLSLSSFPSLSSSGRFMVFGTDSLAARALADSWSETLLPADVGLALYGKTLLLDFSTRPFDTIEFGRMLALSEQLNLHLPAAPARMPSH